MRAFTRPLFTLGSALLISAAPVRALANGDDDFQLPPLAPPPLGAVKQATAWAQSHALPLASLEPGHGFADLQALKPMIGAARVIAFGEGMHDTHEYLALRNRLLEFLVSELGVTALAVESGYTEATAADDYVLGRTPASDAAYGGVFSWSGETPTRENKQLLDWMRAYNARPSTKRKLRFYGLDLSGGGDGGGFPRARIAVDAALAYIARVDAPRATSLQRVLEPVLDRFATQHFSALTQPERDMISGALSDVLGAFEREHVTWIEKSSAFDYHRAYQHAVVAHQLDMQLRSGDPYASQRDPAMARNLLWVLQREGTDGRVLAFAHNSHVRGAPTPMDPGSFGVCAKELLHEQLVLIGSLFNRGSVGTYGGETWPLEVSDPATLNAALHTGAGRDLFYIDTRQFPKRGPLADWVDRGQPLRMHYYEGSPRASFDVLFYVDTIGPSHPLHALHAKQD